ncbi:hypothetical protein [Patulibacter sp. SYSU D01012]|uniref:hypothetical protein n=1 Tax=Patulibacter sp. SYSU D01012 TaxID=2817381 RepID=UPI001B31758E|nr:hypothetical protein [Patulibacter sp. SYSU D01012]
MDRQGDGGSAAYEDIRRRIEGRIRELAPLVEEDERLRAVLRAFDDALGGERPARERVPQLAALVAERPGISQRDAARELGLERTAIYPVVRRAVARGQVVKRDGALHPARSRSGPIGTSNRRAAEAA